MSKGPAHYVPRFYLRNFGSDFHKRKPGLINVFDLQTSSSRRSIPISEVCAISEYYGQDDMIENAFMKLETATAKVIRKMLAERSPPLSSSSDNTTLAAFLLLQRARTPKNEREHARRRHKLRKLVFGGDRDAEVRLIGSGTDDLMLSISIAAQLTNHLSDMASCIIRTQRSVPFVTSDHPTFLYNLYCEGATGLGTTGLVARGLLAFLPISPEVVFVLYDPVVYKVAPKSAKSVMANLSDVDSINRMQFITANKSIFFSGELSLDYLRALQRRAQRPRKRAGPRIAEAVAIDDPLQSIVHQYNQVPNLKLSLSFLSIKRRARRTPFRDRLRMVRHPPPNLLSPEEEALSARLVEGRLFRKIRET